MSVKKQKQYDNLFKAKVALAALKEDKTINEVAAEQSVIPWNVRSWKKQFMENMEVVFDQDRGLKEYKEKLRQKEAENEELYRQIGKLSAQVEWAKKKARQAGIELPADFDK